MKLLLLLAAAFSAASELAAQSIPYVTLWGSGTEAFDRFGQAVTLRGDMLLVGADRDQYMQPPQGGTNGRVYVFRRDATGQWIEEDLLIPGHDETPRGTIQGISGFGASFDLTDDGRRVIVAAHGTSYYASTPSSPPHPEVGAALVFSYDSTGGTWVQEAVLSSPGTEAYEWSGAGVAVSGSDDGAFAVMNGADDRLTIFRHALPAAPGEPATWTEEAALPSDDPYNFSVGFNERPFAARPAATTSDSRERIAASSPAESAGATYVFRNDGPPGGPAAWVREARLAPPFAQGGRFGEFTVLSPDGRLIAVGSRQFCEPDEPGQVYVYRRVGDGAASEWGREAVLTIDGEGETYCAFGASIALSAEPGTGLPLLAAWFSGPRVIGVPGPGQANIYRRSAPTSEPGAWSLAVTTLGHVADPPAFRTVALSEWTLGAGHGSNDERGEEAGVAYVFDLQQAVAAEGGPGASSSVSVAVSPNPAGGAAAVTVTVGEPSSSVRVWVVDVLGREVARVYESALMAGRHRLAWSASGLPAGVYVVRVEADGAAVATARVVVAR